VQEQQLAIDLDEEKRQQLEKLMPPNEYKRFLEYINEVNEGSKEKSELFTFDESIEDKNIRSAIHQTFKATEIFETDTMMEEGARRIRVFLKNSLSANKRKKLNIINRKAPEEREMPQYLQVVIQKTNVDTMQAIHYIAKKIKKYGKHFQIAGNKDKRGITTQRATIIRGDPETIIRF
jgi:tRNA pseudouridine13 synthase